MLKRSLILSLLAASVAAAQSAPVTPTERANADAVARLYARIATEQVGDVPVSQIVERVGGYTLLIDGLSRAEQLGGPREVAPDVVQVRLQISGARASQLLMQAVAAKPDESPVPPERLAFALQQWGNRTFTSTGDSVEATTRPATATTGTGTARAVEPASPLTWRTAPAWAADPIGASGISASVGPPLRTARAAEQAARSALREKLRGLPTGDGKATVGDAVEKVPESAAALDATVAAARVAGVDYRGDGSVQVRISVPGDRFWQALAAAR